MKIPKGIWVLTIMVYLPVQLLSQDGFRVYPYLQHPSPDAITVRWFSSSDQPGVLIWREREGGHGDEIWSDPAEITALKYSLWEDTTFFGGEAPAAPFRHSVRPEGLKPGTTYDYSVIQGTDTFVSLFQTSPGLLDPVRFIVYADCETEPESTGSFTQWVDPVDDTIRDYLVDQTTGYRHNLEVIRSRDPDLVFIAGDLTQHGGEQRDWDEFWRHNTGGDGTLSLAGRIPLMPALGNHEYYEGNFLDGYDQPGSERAVHRYLSYFDLPPNHSSNPEQEGRYYSLPYGPVTMIVLDLCNNSPNGSEEDTNYYLLGEGDEGGGNAPDFAVGSTQYQWLEKQLETAQTTSLFTFVLFHHAPYSSGPHGWPPGEGDSLDNQSGVPVRALTPLFMQYGVDAVISGHDEIWERSAVTGTETIPGGDPVPHTIQFYDVGIGGDGLRGSVEGTVNPYQEFLVHRDVPEVWEGDILIEGGKHYGHLEVDVIPVEEHSWQAVLTPVYVFPLFNPMDSAYSDYERREYDDRIVVTRILPDTATMLVESGVSEPVLTNHPNPFSRHTTIAFSYPGETDPTLFITDLTGRTVRKWEHCLRNGSRGEIEWDGCDDKGKRLAAGIYFFTLSLEAGERVTQSMLMLDP